MLRERDFHSGHAELLKGFSALISPLRPMNVEPVIEALAIGSCGSQQGWCQIDAQESVRVQMLAEILIEIGCGRGFDKKCPAILSASLSTVEYIQDFQR